MDMIFIMVAWIIIAGVSIHVLVLAAKAIIRYYFREKRENLRALLDASQEEHKENS